MLGFTVLISLIALGATFPQPKENESGGIPCGYSICGKNSECKKTNGYDDCVCLAGFYGSGYGDGCTAEPQCTSDEGCKEEEFCNEQNLCSSVCLFRCPADVGCKVKNHVAECIFDGQLFFDPPSRAQNGTTEAAAAAPPSEEPAKA